MIFYETWFKFFQKGKMIMSEHNGSWRVSYLAKKLGDFGTKICYFIRKNMAENGPLVFRTVLYSKYDEKLGNHERKTLR